MQHHKAGVDGLPPVCETLALAFTAPHFPVLCVCALAAVAVPYGRLLWPSFAGQVENDEGFSALGFLLGDVSSTSPDACSPPVSAVMPMEWGR